MGIGEGSVSKTYMIKEVFNTIQGEGARAGSRSVFVRFVACNLWDGNPLHRHLGKGACSKWCDTDFAKGDPMTGEQLLAEMNRLWPKAAEPRWVVFSGGEPLLQVDKDLCDLVMADGWRIAVETNGSVQPKADVFDLISHLTVSPKRGAPLVLNYADELKVVLPGSADEPWSDAELEKMAKHLNPVELFVQPQDPIDTEKVNASHLSQALESDPRAALHYMANEKRCVEFVMRNPIWRVSLQTHKFLRVP